MGTERMLPRCGEEDARSISPLRCAVYTRKSTEEGLNQEFNSLEAQREAAEAYIASQRQLGWILVSERYDDGGYTGGNMQRPALQKLLADIEQGNIDCILIYKVDRLSRSLLDFARLTAIFEQHRVNLVSITQPLNTTTSLGRLTLNILLSFAHYAERAIMQSHGPERAAWAAFG
jgi:site-specific DNA recombinase